ncbi:MAG: TPM domain-containing protein [Myxococcota bacterium]
MLALVTSVVFALAPVPRIDAAVTDEAGVLTAATVQQLDEQLRQHKAASGVQLAVLFVDTTDGEPIEDFALRAAMAWGGGERRKDDGGLFVLAVKDRQMRLELGYGLEGLVPDATAASVLDGLKPSLRAGDYDAAATQVVAELTRLTRRGVPAPPPAPVRAPLLGGVVGELLSVIDVAWVLVLLAFVTLGRWIYSKHTWDGIEVSEGTLWSNQQVMFASAVLVAIVCGLLGLFGFGWGLWYPAVLALLVGSLVLGRGPWGWSLAYLAGLGVATMAMQAAWADPLDQRIFSYLAQGAVSIGLIIVTYLERDQPTSYASDFGASSRGWSTADSLFSSTRESSRSSFGSSFSSSSSSAASSSSGGSSGGGYSGGGGSFGGGGASSSW